MVSPSTCISFEMLWWTRFNKSREKKLRTLFGERERVRRLAASFDALSKIPALFDAGMMVTTLNKVMGTKCYEASTAPGCSGLFADALAYRRYATTMRNIFSRPGRIS
jgi:hypothetical protein